MALLQLVTTASARRCAQSLLPAVCSAVSTLSSSNLQLAGSSAAAAGLQQLPSSAQAALRSFHAGTALLASEHERALSAVLASEIKHEQTNYEQEELVARGPPAPFKLSSTPGDTAISLTRTFNNETVSVDCSVNMQDSLAGPFGDEGGDEDEEELGDDPNDVNFNVSVTKGDTSLVFECISDGTYVDIRHVSLEPEGGLDSETAFTGPVFAELDDGMQEALRAYLAERGIDEALGEYLRYLMYDKEQQEYVRWLQGVKAFVDKA